MRSLLPVFCAAGLLLGTAGVCFAQADVGAASGVEAREGNLVEDGTVYINEVGTLINGQGPEAKEPVYMHVFVDSKDRPMAILPCEVLERLRAMIGIDPKTKKTVVFLSDIGQARVLAPDEVIVFRVIRGIASRYGKVNYIMIQDAAYKVEKRPTEVGPVTAEGEGGEGEGAGEGGGAEGGGDDDDSGWGVDDGE